MTDIGRKKVIGEGGKKSSPDLKARYGALDGLRTLACIGIVLMHIKSNVSVKPSATWVMDNVISFTGNFVLLFMMISAFSVSCGYFERFRNGTISLDSFYKKRYSRILPFFALLVVIDILQTAMSERFCLTESMSAELYEAYADLTLAFGLLPGANISVIGVGWFLGVIFLFYMLYPFFTFLLNTRRRAWFVLAVMIGLWICLHNYFIPVKGVVSGYTNIILCAPYFILGGMIYLYRIDISTICKRMFMRISIYRWLVLATLFYTILFFAIPLIRKIPFSQLVLYALWLVTAISDSSMWSRFSLLDNKFMAFISSVSMEIYLCHMMLFRIVERCHLDSLLTDNDMYYWAVSLFVMVGAIMFSLIWKLIWTRITSVQKCI